jgi:hypothetical protein
VDYDMGNGVQDSCLTGNIDVWQSISIATNPDVKTGRGGSHLSICAYAIFSAVTYLRPLQQLHLNYLENLSRFQFTLYHGEKVTSGVGWCVLLYLSLNPPHDLCSLPRHLRIPTKPTSPSLPVKPIFLSLLPLDVFSALRSYVSFHQLSDLTFIRAYCLHIEVRHPSREL